MKFIYQACDKTGKPVSNAIEASSTVEAIDLLRREGLFVTSVAPAGTDGPAPAAPGRARSISGHRAKKNLMVFTRHMHLLLSTGTPIVEALESLEQQTKDPGWRAVLTKVRQHVEQGSSLSDALGDHPECFDSVYCSLISAGEQSGKMSVMLERLAILTQKQIRIHNAVVGAMVYPCLLITVAVAVVTLMFVFVMPRFESLFEKLSVPLPPSTKFILFISNNLRDHWLIFAVSCVAAVFGSRFWVRSDTGKRTIDTVLLQLPYVGYLARSFTTARIARFLGVLLESSLPLTEILDLLKNSTRNHHYAALLARTQDAVTRGEPISASFAGNDLVHPIVQQAIRSGEKTGQMAVSLITVADYMDEENDTVVKSLTSILEPLILIVLGVIVGMMALSMFVPLFDLTSVGS